MASNCPNCFLEFHKDSLLQHECCSKLTWCQEVFEIDCLQYYGKKTKNLKHQLKGLTVLHQNVRSLRKNIHFLRERLDCFRSETVCCPDIIGVTETWIESDLEAKLKSYEIDGYEFISSHRTKGKRGGVGQYILKGIEFIRRDDLELREAESLWTEITLFNNKKIIMGTIYSSPVQRDVSNFYEDLDEILEELNRQKKKVILMGDFNLNLFHSSVKEYCRVLLSNGYKCLTSFPTRNTQQTKTASLIDHIITNITEIDRKWISGVLDTDISDHSLIFATLSLNVNKKHIETPYKVMSFNNYTIEQVYDNISKVTWDDINNNDDANNAMSNFINKLKYSQNKCIPLIEINSKTGYKQPWITEEIRKEQKQRYKLFRKHRKYPDNEIFKENYKKFRNRLCSKIRKAER